MEAGNQTIGFIGVGRLGLPLALNLATAGFDVVATSRGRTEELVAGGGRIAGDGSARAVADAAQIVFTCVTDDAALEDVVDGMLSADGPGPTVIQLGVSSIALMERLQERLHEHG